MADLSNNSFIPKRGPAKQRRATVSRQVYIFTLVTYILMFATLLAAGGLYVYNEYFLQKQLESEIAKLDSAINQFNEQEMQRVLSFDRRVHQVTERIEHSASLVKLFDALEATAVDTARISNMEILREGDASVVMTAAIQTDSFDSTISQRNTYGRSDVTKTALVDSVQIGTQQIDPLLGGAPQTVVTFKAEIDVPINEIPFEGVPTTQAPLTVTPSAPPIVVTEPPVESEAVEVPADNQQDI